VQCLEIRSLRDEIAGLAVTDKTRSHQTRLMVLKLSAVARKCFLLFGLLALAGCSDGSASEESNGTGPVAIQKRQQDLDQAGIADRNRRSIHHR
jgi:hypothetical protein